ncbi:MAG TPA: MFS transporter [Chloroflexota bacterium]|nr:MFS transporter [Chloroflexota bacterium]
MSNEPVESELALPPEAEQASPAMPWGLVIPLALGQFLCSYANSALNVSISDISADLGTTVTGVQTAITLFTLVMAALMITGSKLTDIWGRKWTFLLGILVFAVGATIAGLAPAMGGMVLGFSLLQGIATALLIPPVYILATVGINDLRARAAAFGIIGGAGGVGAAAGPLIGGIITSAISWRATFASEVLLALVILVLSRKIVDVPFVGTKPKLDFVGVFLSAAGMAFVVLGVMQASDYGWLQARQDWVIAGRVLIPQGGISPVWPLVGIGLLLFWQFFRHIRSQEEAGKEPLVHLRVLRSGLTNIGLLTQNFQWFVLLGSSFVIAVYFQVARANSAIETGLLMTPATLGVLIASARIQNIVKRRPGRQVLVLGFGVAAVGIFLMLVAAMLVANDWALAPGLFVFGLGMGAVLPASVTLVQSSMPEEDQSEISGVSRSVSNLGSSLGTAVAGAVMVSVLITGVTSLTQASQVLPPAAKDQIAVALQGDVATLSDAQVTAALAGQPPEIVNEVVRINAEARNRAMGMSMVVLGLVTLLGLAVSLRLPKGRLRPVPEPVAST